MKNKLFSIIPAFAIAAIVFLLSGCSPSAPLPDDIVEAVSVVATGNGFQPREPHFLLEQFVPGVTGNRKQRAQMASILLEAIADKETTPAGRTVIAQHLALVAGKSEIKALKEMLGDPQAEADIRIALGEAASSSFTKESKDVYLAEIMSNDPAKQIAGLSGISVFYPEAAVAYCLEMINSKESAVYATAIRLAADLDARTLIAEFPGLNAENQSKVLRIVEKQRLTEIRNSVSPIEEPVIKANEGAEKKALVVTGLEYPGHPWQETAPALVDILAQDKRLEVSYIEDPRILAEPLLNAYDVIVLNYQNHQVPAPAGALVNLKNVVEGGKGLVIFHFASGAFMDWDANEVKKDFAEIAGRVWNPKLRGHDPRGPFRVQIADNEHPITKSLADFDTDDELYTCLDGTVPIQMLATARSIVDQKDYPMAFVLTPGKGRTFHCALGHDLKALNEPVRELFLRGTLWAAAVDVDQ